MPMTDEEIRSVLDEEIRGAIGYDSSELANQRKTALEYYYGEPFGNEQEGRSSYVSRDVADTIEWIMPSLMKIFMGGDTVVRFEPQGPEDEQAAEQATDYINYIFQKQNDGFLTLYTWFKDALISKNGFVKVYWEKYSDVKTNTYEGLTEDQMAMMLQDPELEVLEHSQEGEFHSLKVRKTVNGGKCCVIPVPPEEVLVNRYPVAPLSRNRFVCHRRRVTISELREMGYTDVDGLTSHEDLDFNEERTTRYSFDETDEGDNPTRDDARYVWLAECYIKIDLDGDGIAELRKITLAGDRLMDNEEVESCPFVTLTPIPLPHKLFGMSVADLVMDLQLLKSTVFRQILDNMYLANNGRYMALDGMVNIDDLLVNRPGGIVRVKTFDAVKPMQPPLLGAPAFNLLEYIDTIKENRTGVTRYNQGIDANSLNKTATGINQIMSAAQQRVELIARVFAETGVKDLFYAILGCVQRHQKAKQVVRLRNEWVPMDPQEWSNKFDLTVAVGLGTGSKESIIGGLLKVLEIQFSALQGGLPVVTPENIYHTAIELLKAQSVKGGDLFFTHPSKIPPAAPQQDPKVMLEMQKLQQDAQKDAADFQLKSGKLALTAKQHEDKVNLERTRIVMDTKNQRDIEGAKIMEQKESRAQQAAMEERREQREAQASAKEGARGQGAKETLKRVGQVLGELEKSDVVLVYDENGMRKAA